MTVIEFYYFHRVQEDIFLAAFPSKFIFINEKFTLVTRFTISRFNKNCAFMLTKSQLIAPISNANFDMN